MSINVGVGKDANGVKEERAVGLRSMLQNTICWGLSLAEQGRIQGAGEPRMRLRGLLWLVWMPFIQTPRMMYEIFCITRLASITLAT